MRDLLVEKKDRHRIRIVLDASKVNRCRWCGSPLSDNWITTEEGVFCSESCMRAALPQWNLVLGLAVIIITVLYSLMIMWSMDSYFVSFNTKVQVVVSCIVVLSFFSIVIFLDFRNHRRCAAEIPRGSRSHIGISNASLLQRISAPIECPNCDAKIDLANIGEKTIYTCQYCGANGVVEIDVQELGRAKKPWLLDNHR